MRHAKSSWEDPTIPDHDRPLNNRGKNDAPRMGKLLKEINLIPDILISSTAKRAEMTAKKVAKSCQYRKDIIFKSSLYSANPSTLVKELKMIKEEGNHTALLVGHNPAVEEFVEYLTDKIEILPTSAVVQIELPINKWNDLDNKTKGSIVNVWRPKELN
jgi:phosphohistidine phosphatase